MASPATRITKMVGSACWEIQLTSPSVFSLTLTKIPWFSAFKRDPRQVEETTTILSPFVRDSLPSGTNPCPSLNSMASWISYARLTDWGQLTRFSNSLRESLRSTSENGNSCWLEILQIYGSMNNIHAKCMLKHTLLTKHRVNIEKRFIRTKYHQWILNKVSIYKYTSHPSLYKYINISSSIILQTHYYCYYY